MFVLAAPSQSGQAYVIIGLMYALYNISFAFGVKSLLFSRVMVFLSLNVAYCLIAFMCGA